MSSNVSILLVKTTKNLLLCKPSHNMISSRGVKGVPRVIRTKLPQYKKNLSKLPPLTQLLTAEDSNSHLDAIKLRELKLDVYKQYLPVNTSTNLIEAMFHKDNDVNRLLRVIDLNLESMTSFYIGVSFEALDDMMKADKEAKAIVAVSPEFHRLCTKTLYKIRFFEADEVLKLVKCLTTLDIPEDTLIMQAAIQMGGHLINDFNQDELECLERSSKFRALLSARTVQCNK